MRIEFLDNWNMQDRISVQTVVQSARVTWVLSVCIVLSLLAVIYVKYENHRLYNDVKHLEHKTYSIYKEHQVVSSQRVKALGFESIEKFVRNNFAFDKIKV